MTTSATAHRIHLRERIAAEDVILLAPDEVLVRGVLLPTTTSGGLYKPDAGTKGEPIKEVRAPVRNSRVFEIAKLPVEMSRGNPLALAVGDIVICRNALVDPLYGNEVAMTNMYMGVVAVVERAPEVRG